jgi:ABC-type polysaccharide/polyol phosphate transport system ATPase subunit
LLSPQPVPADLSVPWTSLGKHRQTNLAVYQMCKGYGKNKSDLAVDHVSFALHPNEGLGLIGSNGLSVLFFGG